MGSCSVLVQPGTAAKAKAVVYLGHPRGGDSRAGQPGRWLRHTAAGTAMSRGTLRPRQGYVTPSISAFALQQSAAACALQALNTVLHALQEFPRATAGALKDAQAVGFLALQQALCSQM